MSGSIPTGRKFLLFALVMFFAGSTVPARAGSDDARQVVYRADNYTAYAERPGYCTLYLDTPNGAMVRMSLDASTGSANWSYYRYDFPRRAAGRSFPVALQFDDSRTMRVLQMEGTLLPDGRPGFGADFQDLLEAWAQSGTVRLRLGGTEPTLIDTIALNGSARAVAALRRCAAGDRAPGRSPTSASDDVEARLTFRCEGEDGETLIRFEGQDIARDISCGPDRLPNVKYRRFPGGVTVAMLVEKFGGRTHSSGDLLRLKTGERPIYVPVPNMLEWHRAISATQFEYGDAGHLSDGIDHWRCRITIDWKNGKIARSVALDQPSYCAIKEEPFAA